MCWGLWMENFTKEMVEEVVDFSSLNSFGKVLENCMAKHSALQAITDTYNDIEMTYAELLEHINLFARGLQSIGVKKGDTVGLFSENNGRWIVMDQSIVKCGAIGAIRGAQAPPEELCYITLHSDSKGLILQDVKLLETLTPFLKDLELEFIILMFKSKGVDIREINCPVYYYEDVLEMGSKSEFTPVQIERQDTATILYTSGTTGMPKGVELSHFNIISQLEVFQEILLAQAGEKTLQILPIWHAYEKIAQTYYYTRGCHLHFSTLGGLKNDLLKYDIDMFMSVPRIWESIRIGIYQKLKQKSTLSYLLFDFAIKWSIRYKMRKMYAERRITNKNRYNIISTFKHRIIRIFTKPLHSLFTKTLYKKVKALVGLNFRVSISGGGALSMQDELFYDAMGVNLRVGYGMTESSPVIAVRGVQDKNYLGSTGTAIKRTELKIVNPKTFEELPKFTKGLVIIRGPQVMKSYHKDPDATKAIISNDGWLNTGDLGWLTNESNLVLVGRLKETIVLSSGENVEPLPIEEACLTSPYIDQMVLVGQDQNGLGALIVPSKEALEKCGVSIKELISYKDSQIDDSALQELIKKEIKTHIVKKQNLRVFEQVKKIVLLAENFSLENGLLSATAKVKRNKIFEKYKDTISKMYTKN